MEGNQDSVGSKTPEHLLSPGDDSQVIERENTGSADLENNTSFQHEDLESPEESLEDFLKGLQANKERRVAEEYDDFAKSMERFSKDSEKIELNSEYDTDHNPSTDIWFVMSEGKMPANFGELPLALGLPDASIAAVIMPKLGSGIIINVPISAETMAKILPPDINPKLKTVLDHAIAEGYQRTIPGRIQGMKFLRQSLLDVSNNTHQ